VVGPEIECDFGRLDHFGRGIGQEPEGNDGEVIELQIECELDRLDHFGEEEPEPEPIEGGKEEENHRLERSAG
jgi:hypothetical protein